MSDEKLLPCPFCGAAEPLLIRRPAFIVCSRCSTEGPIIEDEDWGDQRWLTATIAAWNRRTAESCRTDKDEAPKPAPTGKNVAKPNATMSQSYDPFEEDMQDAARTKCPKCDESYQVVRPGKIQPSCSCEYVDGLVRDRDEAIAERDAAVARAESLFKRNQELVLERDVSNARALEAETRLHAVKAGLESLRGEVAIAKAGEADAWRAAKKAEAERDTFQAVATQKINNLERGLQGAWDERDRLKAALAALVNAMEDAMESHVEWSSWYRKGDFSGYLAKANAALAPGGASEGT